MVSLMCGGRVSTRVYELLNVHQGSDSDLVVFAESCLTYSQHKQEL